MKSFEDVIKIVLIALACPLAVPIVLRENDNGGNQNERN